MASHVTRRPPRSTSQESDKELLARCAENDRSAWGLLVVRYKDLVFSTALKVGLSSEDAGDVFQETFFELYRSAGRIRNPEALPRWLMIATRRRSYKVATQRRRMLPDVSKDLIDPAKLVEEEVIASESRRQLEAGLNTMGGRCAKLLRFLFFSDEPPSYDEISTRFGLARGSVGPIRSRCLKRLRNLLEKGE